MDCDGASSASTSCSLLSSNKDFTSSLFASALEGSFDSARSLAEFESVIPSNLPLPSGLELDSENVAAAFATNAHIIPTPPPENSNLSPASLSHYSPASSNASDYIKGSSLEESPLSSPEGSDADTDLFILPASTNLSLCSSTHVRGLKEDSTGILELEETREESDGCVRMPKLLVSKTASTGSPQSAQEKDGHPTVSARNGELKKEAPSSHPGSPKSKQDTVPRNIKLPQRKGGMQLWQFLYALLGNSASTKYGKLIEWTANRNSREFRLLEPEAIAIWWGEHKNKKNMSYDKLSRSLRYYYDKGIIRKIPGERYVYQFCIDPEVMYKHIGNSDCRPKLKPMPPNAHRATSDYQLRHGFNHTMLHKEPMFMSSGPFMVAQNGLPGSYPLSNPQEIPFPPPEYPSLSGYPSANFFENAFAPPGMDMYTTTPMTPPAGMEFGEPSDMKPHLPIRKCSSFDSHYIFTSDADGSFGHSLMPPSSFVPGMGPPPLQSISPPHPPSEGNSPQMSSFPQHPQLLDELIEPAASCELSHSAIVYSSCNEGPFAAAPVEAPVSWSF